jgi:hypothetical protein
MKMKTRPWEGKHFKEIFVAVEQLSKEYMKVQGEWQIGYGLGLHTAICSLVGALKEDYEEEINDM